MKAKTYSALSEPLTKTYYVKLGYSLKEYGWATVKVSATSEQEAIEIAAEGDGDCIDIDRVNADYVEYDINEVLYVEDADGNKEVY